MSTWDLILRSLRHYWRLNLGLLAGVVLSSAILTGALVVGDSVRESLRQIASGRLGPVKTAVLAGDRFFTKELARKSSPDGAALLLLAGTTSVLNGPRANGVQVLGVGTDFWKLTGASHPWGDDDFAVNEALASRLSLKVGTPLTIRVEKPGAISRDAPLSGESAAEDTTVLIRGKVGTIITRRHLGLFNLRTEQTPALNLFVSLARLQSAVEKPGKVNLLLDAKATASELEARLRNDWSLEDAELQRKELPGGGFQIVTSRIFMKSDVADAVVTAGGGDAVRVMTFLVNQISKSPYSMVASVSANAGIPGLERGKIVINRWLADRNQLKVGDSLNLDYFRMTEGRKLVSKSTAFEVSGILPMNHPALNPTWTPDFPGVSEAADCRDWKPGFELELEVTKADEDYWDQYKGTPKGFIALQDGQEIWQNRFGTISSVRFSAANKADIPMDRLRELISPLEFGFHVRALDAEGEVAATTGIPFGALFAMMSFFLVAAALALTAMLFGFGMQTRASQLGLLQAAGLTLWQVRKVLLIEAGLVAMLGAAAGAALGVLYTKLALWGLETIWSDAVIGMSFQYHASSITIIAGALAVFGVAELASVIVTRKLSRISPAALLQGRLQKDSSLRIPGGKGWSFRLLVIGLAGGVLLAIMGWGASADDARNYFYGAGSLLILAGLSGVAFAMRKSAEAGTRSGMVWTNARRRPARSLTVVGVMALGVFMIVSTNAFRLGTAGADRRDSGTGGFAFLGETSIPVYDDLNTETGRNVYGLEGGSFVQFRQSAGDDASCLNLNRAQNPQLLGVNPGDLSERKAFGFAQSTGDARDPWSLLSEKMEGRLIPGIADMNTAVYGLGKSLGDDLYYRTDDGREFAVRLVALLKPSVLQGRIIIGENAFRDLFPDRGGYQLFLVDAKPESAGELAGDITRQMEDVGMSLVPAKERLAEFNAVQNSYIGIFTVLGGLGVLLGTVGLGIVVSRNVVERQGEMGLLHAVGFSRGQLLRMLLLEHWTLHVLGVVIGTVAAGIAVVPQVASSFSDFPLGVILSLITGILVTGLLFCWIAVKLNSRRPFLDALRTE